jgi:hypothetical protein
VPQPCGQKACGGKDHLGDLDVDERILKECVLKKEVRGWMRLKCLKASQIA